MKQQDKDSILPQHSSSHGSSSPPPISPSGYSLSRKSPSNIHKYFQITPLSSTEATAVAAVASSTTTSSSFILSVPSQQTKSVIRPTTSTSISPSSFSPSPSKDYMGNSATTTTSATSASRSTPLYAFSAGSSSSFDSNRPRSSSGGSDTPWTTTTHQTAGAVARRGSPARRKLY